MRMTQLIHLSDSRQQILWQNFRQGDQLAFSQIFQFHYSYLYHYGIRLGADKELAKDCIQELFIHLWENRHRLSHTTSIKYYLMKCYRRKVGKLLGKQRTANQALDDHYDFEIVFSPEAYFITEETSLARQTYLLEALDNLSKRQKEVIYLKFYSNLNYQEIADVMGLNYQSIRNYAHQAILTLRKKKARLLISSDWLSYPG